MSRELQARLEQLEMGYSKTREQMVNETEMRQYPLHTEPALVHPLNSSTVKIRENGCIDVFVGTDNGIRLDPNRRSITILGNRVRTQSQEIVSKTVKDTLFESGKRWEVRADQAIKLEAPEVHLNGKVHISGSLDVNGRSVETE